MTREPPDRGSTELSRTEESSADLQLGLLHSAEHARNLVFESAPREMVDEPMNETDRGWKRWWNDWKGPGGLIALAAFVSLLAWQGVAPGTDAPAPNQASLAAPKTGDDQRSVDHVTVDTLLPGAQSFQVTLLPADQPSQSVVVDQLVAGVPNASAGDNQVVGVDPGSPAGSDGCPEASSTTACPTIVWLTAADNGTATARNTA